MWIAMGPQTTEQAGRAEQEELERLLAGIAQGDREALAELYCRTRAAVYAMALSFLKNAQDAQDVTQDAFVQVWDHAPQYRPHGSPMAWLLTIARNLSRMRLRQGDRRSELSEEAWDALPAAESGLSPEDRQMLQGALGALGDQERQVVLLHAVAGLKHREIAAVLELPLATVLSKYHRALKKMKVLLEGGEDQ